MSKDFKSPVSTIPPRGQRVDIAWQIAEDAAKILAAKAPDRTEDVGTAARFPAHDRISILSGVDRSDFRNFFWSKVKKGEGCWTWLGSLKRGYGRIRIPNSRAQLLAHRLSFYFHTGEDPGEFQVCHTCDNPGCVRPDHLFLGTQFDNMRDKMVKGRHRGGPTAGQQNGNAKLDEDGARAIIAAIMAGESNTAISRRFPVGHALVSRIRTGKAWRPLSQSMGYTPAPAKYAPKSGRTKFGG